MSDDKKKILVPKKRGRGPNELAKELSRRRHARRRAGLPDETVIKIPRTLEKRSIVKDLPKEKKWKPDSGRQ